MEKLGVETNKDLDKTAQDAKHCPDCGKELVKNSNVPCCSSCGTKPFEKEKTDGR